MKGIFTLAAILLALRGQSQVSICAGQQLTLTAPNPSSLSNTSYSINPGGFTSSNSSFILSPTANVTYTIYTTGTNMSSNVVTTTTQTNVTVNGLPTFSLLSTPPNFTIGCSSKSVVTISFINAQTAPPNSGGAISYTVLYPGSGPVTPTGVLPPTYQYSITQAGSYTAITRDNYTWCDAAINFNVVDNKFAPTIDSVSAPVLNCATTVAVLQAYSNSSNINYKWKISPSLAQAGSTVMVYADFNAPVSMTSVAVYTVSVEDNNNLCKTDQVVVVKQNRFPPHAQIQASANALTCLTTSIVLSNSSTSGIPPGTFPTNLPVNAMLWQGPSVGTQTLTSSYVAFYPGVYTLTVKDMNNGCTAVTTQTIYDNMIYPTLNPVGPFNLCNQATTTIVPLFTGNTAGYTYTWSAPAGANTGPANGPALVTDAPGSYTLAATSMYGCETTQVYDVGICIGLIENTKTPSFDVYPNPGKGIFRISFKKTQALNLQVFDAKLALIKEFRINNGETIDLSAQPQGIYFFRVEGEAGTRRIIKE